MVLLKGHRSVFPQLVFISLLLLYPLVSASNDWEYSYSCDLSLFLNDDGKLKKNSGYQYFLYLEHCNRKKDKDKDKDEDKQSVRHRATAAATPEHIGVELEADLVTDTEGTNIIISNSCLPEEEGNIVHLIAAIDFTKNKLAISERSLPTQIREKSAKNALESFRSSKIFTLTPDGTPITYMTPAIQLNTDRLFQLKELMDKLYKIASDFDVEAEIPTAIRKAWLTVSSYYHHLAFFSPLGALALSLFSNAYAEAVALSVTTYEELPTTNFTGCRVFILINTDELIRDMYRQDVLIYDPGNGMGRLTSASTVNEITNAINTSFSRTFQTTGELIRFADAAERCQCPYCGSIDRRAAGEFAGCLVDGLILLDVLLANILGNVHNRLDLPPGNISEIEIYATNISNPDIGNTVLKERLFNFANFSSFDNTNDELFGIPSHCQCQSCPLTPTTASSYYASTALIAANVVVFITGTILPMICYSFCKATYRRINQHH
ncbi:hypothetical protein [Endozoicomonas sp. OPT23]|uniref:hypothetical protein n=1 Tax=Endozoicomonas sp. OPT23 TaxID=2072845 RepID=UPI00129B17DC|nr:hypothetical protein [Endozoicomonas sp. OPT23]